jgi:hypothetical protein
MKLKTITTIFSITITTLLIAQKKNDKVIIISKGLSSPESTYYTNGFIYISNQDGGGMSKDGSGWISKVKTNGEIVNSRWVDKLNAPKGIRSWENLLFVADIDKLIIIDLNTDKIIQQIEISGAKLLNDIIIDTNGNVYISDTVQRAIYKVSNVISENRNIELWAKDLNQAPNGIYLYNNDLYVAGWGTDIREGFKTKNLGKVYKISLKDKKITELTKSIGNLDGIERLKNGKWIFSALWQNSIYIYDPKTKKTNPYNTVDKSMKISPADIGIIEKENILMVPNATENKVFLIKLANT